MLKFGRIILSPLLFIVSLIYGITIYIRNFLFDKNILKSQEFSIPVISVGNITVGGTGKTPHIEYLINLLKDEFYLATLSRGYKRKTKGYILANNTSSAKEIGDEPRQIKQKYKNDITVAVDANRIRGIENILQDKPNTNAVLLDDAFQHRKIKPNISILLIDYSRQLKNDFLLPLGNLREQAIERYRANIIIITKCPHDIEPIKKRIIKKHIKPYPFQKLFFTGFSYGEFIPVFNNITEKITNENILNKKISILIVTGIANPKPLVNYVKENITTNINVLKFPDHHDFDSKDINKIKNIFNKIQSNNKIILTTEKDAMRLQNFSNIADVLKQNLYYLPIKVIFLDDNKQDFNKQIIDYVRKNKENGNIYSRKNKF
ncbi:MAG: tetraacyldisaccharide 4'-kinase [Bacteroidota bacterium]|nr:tetraacyldisaccharide 4'-kinase [Bacteroidota bacterium]